MAIADLKNVLKIFGGSDVSDDEKSDLFKEVLLMTLARAANADVNIQTVEVERIAEILKSILGRSSPRLISALPPAKNCMLKRPCANIWRAFVAN